MEDVTLTKYLFLIIEGPKYPYRHNNPDNKYNTFGTARYSLDTVESFRVFCCLPTELCIYVKFQI